MAFNKKRADARKAWLESYDRDQVLDYTDRSVSFSDLVNKELIHFSMYDLERSIPSMVDGLKVSQRKIIYGVFKTNLIKEKRVSTVASEVQAVSLHHHGELDGSSVADGHILYRKRTQTAAAACARALASCRAR